MTYQYRHKELIENMTLLEKTALLSGKTVWQTRDIPRLSIPSVFCSDGPHGIRKQAGAGDHLGLNASLPATCFPPAATIPNSWDEELGEQIGKALGEEAAALGVNIVLGPGLNIKRSPLCGRNFEYFSEDPYLSGKMAAAYIRGINGQGVYACPKHFAVIIFTGTAEADLPFRTYILEPAVALKEGDNEITLEVTNAEKKTGTIYATATLVDCLYIYSNSNVEWAEGFPMTDNVNK